jgi:single-strand DNA-binding protein
MNAGRVLSEEYKQPIRRYAMGSMNHVFLMGNLTRDPQSRQTTSGTAVTDLGLAVSESYKNKEGTQVESVCFVDVVTWGRQAETCTQYLKKGSPVLVEGRLQLDQWQTESGEKRSKLRVRALRVQFMGKPPAKDGNGETTRESEPADEEAF